MFRTYSARTIRFLMQSRCRYRDFHLILVPIVEINHVFFPFAYETIVPSLKHEMTQKASNDVLSDYEG